MNTCMVITIMPYTVLGQARLLRLSAALTYKRQLALLLQTR